MEINGDCYKECIFYFSPLLVLRSYQNFLVLPLALFENENSFEKQCKHCYLSVPLCQIFLEEKLSSSCSKSNMPFVGKGTDTDICHQRCRQFRTKCASSLVSSSKEVSVQSDNPVASQKLEIIQEYKRYRVFFGTGRQHYWVHACLD